MRKQLAILTAVLLIGGFGIGTVSAEDSGHTQVVRAPGTVTTPDIAGASTVGAGFCQNVSTTPVAHCGTSTVEDGFGAGFWNVSHKTTSVDNFIKAVAEVQAVAVSGVTDGPVVISLGNDRDDDGCTCTGPGTDSGLDGADGDFDNDFNNVSTAPNPKDTGHDHDAGQAHWEGPSVGWDDQAAQCEISGPVTGGVSSCMTSATPDTDSSGHWAHDSLRQDGDTKPNDPDDHTWDTLTVFTGTKVTTSTSETAFAGTVEITLETT